MRREIIHVCRLLLKRVKRLLPLLLIIVSFTFITRGKITTPRNAFYPSGTTWSVRGDDSTLPLRRTMAAIQKQTTEYPLGKFSTYRIKGERNAAQTKDVCQKFQTLSQNIPLTVRWSKNNSLLFCPTYKVGTTFWRRVFMIQREKKYSSFVNPYLLPFDKDYAASKFLWKRNATVSTYKVMFTRDPYNRLFSFFVDKMTAPNPYFWKSVGVKVAVLTRQVRRENIKKICGHDITFPEFIKYVIHTLETRNNIDPHWIEMEKNCRPCEMGYDFIGKMENFNEDSMQVIHKLELKNMAAFLERSGKDASADDAIKDTLSQPFTFLTKYKMCMTFKEALLRAWQKLQIRGLIGNVTLDGVLINEKVTKLGDIIAHAQASRNASLASERTQLKNRKFKELWSQVNITDLYKLKRLYTRDFELFGYDSMPSALFQTRTAT